MPNVTTRNPATGAVLANYETTDPAKLDEILAAAVRAQITWRRTPLDERIRRVREIERVLRERQDEFAMIATREMGKPITQSRAEVAKCATMCTYGAQHAAHALDTVSIDAPVGPARLIHEPLGVVLAIMPWNFPYWQVIRFAVPALLAGNAIVLKHAPNVTGSALMLASILSEAGFPSGLFSVVVFDPDSTAKAVERLISDERVAAVTFTGSNATGAHIARAAGAAIKKSVLELGGSDPFVVLHDVDLDRLIPEAVTARLQNTGQVCLASKRFIVDERIVDEFCERFVVEMDRWLIGSPELDDTRLGPLARPDLASTLARQVAESVQAGATLMTGSQAVPSGEAWFQPALLRGVTPDMPVMAQETFGPVAGIVPFHDDEEAVQLANATPYGLGASVWSADTEHALKVGGQIDSGCLFVNAIVASDVNLPLGGVKQSGYGRELGMHGLREFVNLRSVVVHDAPR